MVRRGIPITAQQIIRMLHESDLEENSIKAIETSLRILRRSPKAPQPTHRIDLNAPASRIDPKIGYSPKRTFWHHSQGQFILDFKKLWIMSSEDCQLSSDATVREWINLVGSAKSPNANLLDFLVAPKNFSVIPKDFCREAYLRNGETKIRGVEIIFAGTAYPGRYNSKWVRYLCDGIEKFDWGWINLKEKVSNRNLRLAVFS